MGYVFLPFALIQRCLAKVRREDTEITFICPFWPMQPWFPCLLERAVDCPRIFGHRARMSNPPAAVGGPDPIIRMEAVRRRLEERGISSLSIDVVSNGVVIPWLLV